MSTVVLILLWPFLTPPNQYRDIASINVTSTSSYIILNSQLGNQPAIRRYLRGGADKSLARPGRKQATATKLGIYSTWSPRSSIHFLSRCSNVCNPFKKIQKVVRPPRSPRQQ